MTFHKGLKTLSALISARNSLHMCEEWHTCDRAIHALVHGFIVSTTVTPTGHHKNNNSNGVQVTQQHSEGEGTEMGEEGVADYLSAIAAACDRVSRLEPCRSTGHGMMDSVYVQPRMAFVGLMKKVVAAGAAGGAGEAVKGEEVGEYGGMDGKYDSSVQNLLAMCAAEAL